MALLSSMKLPQPVRALIVVAISGLVTQAARYDISALRQSSHAGATPVGKVTEMLQEMKSKSESMKEAEAKEHAEQAKTCESVQGEKETDLETMGTQIETLSADVQGAQDDIKNLQSGIMEHESELITDHQLLEETRGLRKEQTASFSKDLAEMNFAIDAVNRAIEALEQAAETAKKAQEGSKASSALVQRAFEKSWREVSQSLRKAFAEQPGTGMTKDEHIFDEFEGTGSGEYESATGGAVGTLKKLKKTFEDERDKVLTDEKQNRMDFEEKQASLLEQIQTGTENQESKKSEKAETETTLATKQKALDDTSANKVSTKEYLTKFKATCEMKAAAFKESQDMRAKEIEALTKAIEIITGTVTTTANKHLPSLMKVRGITKPRAITPEEATDDEQKVLGFLRVEAQKLQSTSLSTLAQNLGTLQPEGPAEEKADPLAKVKDLIRSLIANLQEQAAEEAETKAFCDENLAKNKKLQADANADIDKHTAKIAQLEAAILKLGEQLVALEETMKKTKEDFATITEERDAEKSDNEATIADADTAAEATDAAITVLKDFYAEAQKKESALLETHGHAGQPQDQSGVIGMLEVVRDDFKRLAAKTQAEEAKAASAYKDMKTETDVMQASAQKDHDYKTEEKKEYEKTLPDVKGDLEMGETELANAKKSFEKLKPVCLDVETYEEKVAKREAEIAALREALQMIDEFAAGSSFLQTPVIAAVAHSSKVDEKIKLAKAAAKDPSAVQKVTALLTEIKEEVQADLDDDRKIYKEMSKWCKETMDLKLSTIEEAQDQDRQLVTTIETSAQMKAQLEVQLSNLNKELAKDQEALETATELRDKEHKTFMEDEKDLLQNIHALKNALIVLEKQYGGDQSAPKKERWDTSAEKAELVEAAHEVSQVLNNIPASAAGLALNTITQNAALRDFLEQPTAMLSPGQPQSLVQGDAPSGGEVFGILKQLLETFQADLASSQDTETHQQETYESLKESKQQSITAIQESITQKTSQLADHTKTLSLAKEDLANLRESLSADSKFLQSVTLQCQESDHEFKQREKTRTEEIAALSEAIDTLTAGAGADAVAAEDDGADTKSLVKLHHVHKRGRIFIHHRNHTNVTNKTHVMIAHPKPTPKPNPENIMDAYMKKTKASLSHSGTGSKHLSALLTRHSVMSPAKLVAPKINGKQGLVWVTAFMEEARLAQGSVTNDALKKVIEKTESIREELLEEQKQEREMRDLCIKEDNEAQMSLEEKYAEQQGYNITKQRQTRVITDSEAKIEAINATINEMEAELVTKRTEREEQHAEFRKSVKDQEKTQKVLMEAKATLKDFYGFVQLPAKTSTAKAVKVAPGMVAVASTKTVKTAAKVSQEPTTTTTTPAAGKPQFSKPLKTHGGSKGVMGILDLLVEESQTMVEELVEAEETAATAYQEDVELTKKAVEVKNKEIISLQTAKGDAEVVVVDTKKSDTELLKEMEELYEYRKILDGKCRTLLQNYDKTQSARQAEIDGLQEAKHVLAGQMTSLVQKPEHDFLGHK